jgi:AraC family transcriptional regulator of adaptative response / DNA-3-methyladenine glycosylase II
MENITSDLNHDNCYQALKARDARFDGQFFTAVHSTGIYCRPICPARTPASKGITFYRSAGAASTAGYRPCLRCRPELAPAERYWHSSDAVTDRLSRLVDEGFLDQLGLATLAEKMGYSERHLRRLYKQRWGVGLIEAAQVRRLHLAKQLLQDSALPITEVALASGFGSVRRFNAAVKARWGVSPSLFRRRAGQLSASSDVITLRLQFRPPLDWPHLLNFLKARSLPTVEQVTDNSYQRVVRLRSPAGELVFGHLSVSQRNDKELSVEVSESLLPYMAQLVPRLRRLFDLDANPQAIGSAWLQQAEDMHQLWQRWPGTRVPGVWSPFEVAVRAVLGQQISVKAAITLVTRFVERFGVALPEDLQRPGLSHSFPEPQDLLDANLDGLGITSRRIETIKALAAGFYSGELDFETGDPEQQRQRLLAIKGIGPWTVAYMAMRGLSDPNAFPAGDLILRRGLVIGEEFSEKELQHLSVPWQPWRAYAALLLWRHYTAEVMEKKYVGN